MNGDSLVTPRAQPLCLWLSIALCLLLAQVSERRWLRAEAQTATCGAFNWDGRFGGEQGVNGTVLALALSPTGELFVGGRFTRAGKVNANNVAYWRAAQGWAAVNGKGGQGVSGGGGATALARFSNKLYVAGEFTEANVGGNAAFTAKQVLRQKQSGLDRPRQD